MVGRREFLLISDFVMALCLGTLGFYFWQQGHEVDVSSYNLIPFISLGTYIFMCTLGSDPIPRVMIRNVLNPERIGFAIGIVCLCASLVQLCVVSSRTWRLLNVVSPPFFRRRAFRTHPSPSKSLSPTRLGQLTSTSRRSRTPSGHSRPSSRHSRLTTRQQVAHRQLTPLENSRATNSRLCTNPYSHPVVVLLPPSVR
ncbi:unnamed protein product [Aphis gossypii]|uniref:Uncharacterized protein n=1 Tax=Aphis gossypii TaxID=80765 RepID=A0A9P0IJU2_APHGO|nr:unnamed protein product [Aphis gossypii]